MIYDEAKTDEAVSSMGLARVGLREMIKYANIEVENEIEDMRDMQVLLDMYRAVTAFYEHLTGDRRINRIGTIVNYEKC